MGKSNALSFLLGVCLVLGCLLFISATDDTPKYEIGRYQLATAGASGIAAFVTDTTTGETKICYAPGIGGTNQLGIPFDKMDKK